MPQKKRRLSSLLLFYDFAVAVNHVLLFDTVVAANALSVAILKSEPVKHFSYLPCFYLGGLPSL
jgi:predicted small integral membrane protein